MTPCKTTFEIEIRKSGCAKRFLRVGLPILTDNDVGMAISGPFKAKNGLLKIFTFYGENLEKKVPARHGTSVSLVIQTISCRIKT